MVTDDILLLDCGNSSCKYRLNQTVGRLTTLEAVLALIEAQRPRRVVVATVSKLGASLCSRLAQDGIDYRRLQVRNHWQGLALAYPEPQCLGIDRWLALVAVCHRQRPVLVVDAGTALTLDAITASNRHLGGYILPGLSLMRRTLVDDTFALPPVELAGDSSPGRNTAECIANGAVLALAGAVERSLRQFDLTEPELIWTGGDAEAIRNQTAVPGKLEPELLFEGMTYLMEDSHYMESLE